ncbi:MAG: nickel pincer cofactor biosynthesis protein LarC [Polyangiaceae bacterium]
MLEANAGKNQILFLDCFSGIAGDMTVAALLDLGVPPAIVQEVPEKLGLDGCELVITGAERSRIVATRFDVRVTGDQPPRNYKTIDDLLAAAPLDETVKDLARRMFLRLGKAEARAHRVKLEEVHFHEVGGVDALVDIVGAASCIAFIGAEVVATPLPMGRGFVKASHGTLPLPAPATLSCLSGVPTYGVDLDVELVTPTGATIVATAASRFERWPAMSPDRVGFGAGTRTLPDRPNLLRAVLGTPTESGLSETTHVVLEANVDDMSGELAAHAISALLAAGALDAWATPISMKKGRPALTIAALTERATAERVGDTILRETTSIGLRRTAVTRTILPRKIVMVTTRFGALPVKVSGHGHHAHAKPELAACATAAAEHGVPLRQVLEEALAAFSTGRNGL